jgi:hypothetical protein
MVAADGRLKAIRCTRPNAGEQERRIVRTGKDDASEATLSGRSDRPQQLDGTGIILFDLDEDDAGRQRRELEQELGAVGEPAERRKGRGAKSFERLPRARATSKHVDWGHRGTSTNDHAKCTRIAA